MVTVMRFCIDLLVMNLLSSSLKWITKKECELFRNFLLEQSRKMMGDGFYFSIDNSI